MTGCMADPVIVPRAEHTISRKDIDPDAFKVLYRLRDFNYAAYLVGGGVRDLLLGRKPKDFDVGTDAHPYQIKKLFRNCWIIGRRFRLAHVRFGTKTIEVATFRRHLAAVDGEDGRAPTRVTRRRSTRAAMRARTAGARHENTFGTSEEDAFRRDFTINALFYDIATFSLIDYVGGLEDLRRRVIRSIGDPRQRFEEDPVRMLRAVAFASRLDFSARSTDRRGDSRAAAADGDGIGRPPGRGVLQDPPLGVGGAHLPTAGRARPARTGHAGAAAQAPPTSRCGSHCARSTPIGGGSSKCLASSPTPCSSVRCCCPSG